MVHMELAATCWKHNLVPCSSHTFRDGNVWADELSKQDTSGWNPALRYVPSFGGKFFFVLDKLLCPQGGID